MQAELQLRVSLEDVEKRLVSVLVCLFEDVIKIADRLMIVQNQYQADMLRHSRVGRAEARRRVRGPFFLLVTDGQPSVGHFLFGNRSRPLN